MVAAPMTQKMSSLNLSLEQKLVQLAERKRFSTRRLSKPTTGVIVCLRPFFLEVGLVVPEE